LAQVPLEIDSMMKHAPDQQIALHLETSPASELCADKLEQSIIRADIRHVFEAKKTGGISTVMVTHVGQLEVRLAEMLDNNPDLGMPPLWLEVFSMRHPLPFDSYGMSEFDDGEITAGTEFIFEPAGKAKS
jgi:hypothetical protein